MVEYEYAKAVFDLAKEDNKIDALEECFKAVVQSANADFMDIMNSPFIHKDEKKKIIKKVYKSLDTEFIHFLYVLIDHNRFNRIGDIYEEYLDLVSEERNIIRVTLVSVDKLNASKIKDFKKALENQYAGKTIEIMNEIDPNLIGGVKIITDEKSMDASVRGTLDKIRESI